VNIRWIKEGLIYGLAGVLSKFTGVFLIPIYTRFLTTEAYGLLDLCTMVSAILLILVETQMASGVMRSYYESKEKNERDSLVGTAFTYYLMANVAMWGVLWFLRGTLVRYLPEFQPNLLLPILATVLPTQVIQLVLILLRLEHRLKPYLILAVGQLWLAAIFGIVAVVFLKAGVVGILWSLAVSKLVFVIPSLFLCYRMVGIRLNLSYFRELFAYSAPIVPATLGNWVQTYASRLFIVGALSFSVLGIYSVANKIASLFLLLALAFRLTWQPYAVKQYTIPNSEGKFSKALNLYLFGTFVVLVLLSTASPILVRILAAKPFWAATPYVAILAAGYLWNGAVTILAAGNNWERKTYYNTLGSVVGGVVAVALLWWGIGRFGLPIVALSFYAGMVTKAMLILWTAQYNHPIPYSKRSIGVVLVASLLYSIICYGFIERITLDLVSTTAVCLLIGVTLVMIMWFTILRPGERALMKSIAKESLLIAIRWVSREAIL